MQDSMYKTINIELDGKTSGFAAYIYSTQKFISENGQQKKLFKNLNLLRSWASGNNINNPYDIKLFLIFDGIEVEYEDVQKIHDFDFYEYCDPSNKNCYHILEDNTEKVSNIGYISFGDFSSNINNKDGKRINNECVNKVYRTAGLLNKRPSNKIDRIVWANPYILKNGTKTGSHLIISLKGSTEKIHIIKNSDLIEFNMIRKDMGNRCLPFEKEMDKYRSLYFYITKDNDDIKDGSDANEVLDKLVNGINYLEPYVCARLIPVEFQGSIFVGGLERESNKNK